MVEPRTLAAWIGSSSGKPTPGVLVPDCAAMRMPGIAAHTATMTKPISLVHVTRMPESRAA